MQPVIVPYNNAEDDKEEDEKSNYTRSKLDEEDNACVDFQNNNVESEKYEEGNAGDDKKFVDNLVWEDIGNNIVILYIIYHYCGPHGFQELAEKLFQTVIECIMITSGMWLEYFRLVTAHSNKYSRLCSVGGNFRGIKWENITQLSRWSNYMELCFSQTNSLITLESMKVILNLHCMFELDMATM